jgi:hypothetical protein
MMSDVRLQVALFDKPMLQRNGSGQQERTLTPCEQAAIQRLQGGCPRRDHLPAQLGNGLSGQRSAMAIDFHLILQSRLTRPGVTTTPQ